MDRVIVFLDDFNWAGKEFALGDDIQIVSNNGDVDLSKWDYLLSKYDRENRINFITHMLSLPKEGTFGRSPMTIVHLFLFCLWIVKYSGAYVYYVLEPSSNQTTSMRRILGHYRYVLPKVKADITTSDLKKVSNFLPTAADLHGKRHRLAAALFFTHIMKTQGNWVPGLIAGVSAIEALFSKSTKEGQTFVVCRRVAAFLGSSKNRQIVTGRKMLKIYDLRSDLVHGRYELNTGDEEKANLHLDRLYQTESLLRRCWKKILADPKLVEVFQDDMRRETYLNKSASQLSKKDLVP